MRVLWTSPHCRPDWLDRLGEESQGGQSVVMNKLPHALTHADPTVRVDIFTRLQDDDPHAADLVKFLDDAPPRAGRPIQPLRGGPADAQRIRIGGGLTLAGAEPLPSR